MTTIRQDRADWDLKELLPSIPSEGIQILERYIADFYPHKSEYPYHDSHHPFEVLDSAIQIINRCEEQGIKVDRTVVVLGALLHDLLFHLDPDIFNQPDIATREDVAAFVSKGILKRIGVPEDVIEKVSSVILATHPDGSLDTVEAKVLRAADLARLLEPYDIVRNATERLFVEYKI